MGQQPDEEQRLWRQHLAFCSKVWSTNRSEELMRLGVELGGVRKFVNAALSKAGR
jgi:hypothetical protein